MEEITVKVSKAQKNFKMKGMSVEKKNNCLILVLALASPIIHVFPLCLALARGYRGRYVYIKG